MKDLYDTCVIHNNKKCNREDTEEGRSVARNPSLLGTYYKFRNSRRPDMKLSNDNCELRFYTVFT